MILSSPEWCLSPWNSGVDPYTKRSPFFFKKMMWLARKATPITFPVNEANCESSLSASSCMSSTLGPMLIWWGETRMIVLSLAVSSDSWESWMSAWTVTTLRVPLSSETNFSCTGMRPALVTIWTSSITFDADPNFLCVLTTLRVFLSCFSSSSRLDTSCEMQAEIGIELKQPSVVVFSSSLNSSAFWKKISVWFSTC